MPRFEVSSFSAKSSRADSKVSPSREGGTDRYEGRRVQLDFVASGMLYSIELSPVALFDLETDAILSMLAAWPDVRQGALACASNRSIWGSRALARMHITVAGGDYERRSQSSSAERR